MTLVFGCTEVVIDSPSLEVTYELRPTDVLVVPVVGPQGPAGTSGAAFNVIAGATLSGHRIVRPQTDGTVVYATNTDIADAGRPLWITLAAALTGASVSVQGLGLVTEPSWTWSDGPIFLGINGLLTQIPPIAPAAFLIQVAASDSPTSLFYDPRNPIAVD